MQTDTQETPPTEKNVSFTPKLYSIAIIVAAILIIGFGLVTRYISIDVARDMRTWQEKLNLIAESRAADVTKYVNDHFKELHSLSENPSLQLYLTELEMLPATNKKGEPPAQLEYLRNLLLFTAQRGGYLPGSQVVNIPANVESNSKSGIAILNNKGEIVVSTAMSQKVKDTIVGNAGAMQGSADALIDLNKDDEGATYMGFIVPIYSIQGEQNKDSEVGMIVAIQTVGQEFFSLLKHPGVTEKTLENTLVRIDSDNIEFLTPLNDKSEALTKQIDKNANRFVEAKLMETPGNFISDMKDYAKKKVLATSREISGTPWVLIAKVESEEALRDSAKNRNSMIAFFVLAIFIIVLTIIAIWWQASSKRSLMLSRHFRDLAAQAQAQENLLRLVSDNQPEPIFILDDENRYQFANAKAAEHAGMTEASVLGKHVRDVRGTARAEHIMSYAQTALTHQQVGYHTFSHEERGMNRTFRSVYVPVSHIPVAGLDVPTPGVLVVEQEITEVLAEREKRLQIHQDLIDTLVTLVDRRDPFAANHSLMVSGLARHIALQMELDAVTVETTRIAASLMNIGKIVISTKLLTKTEMLTDEERHIIRDSMIDAAELVKPIHFEGPVYETLRQWQEKWDGSGMLALKGDNILISARILTVANTFIGMISPRSWRTAMSVEEAIKFLMGNCGSLFDRRVVVALVHFIENHHGQEWLNGMLVSREAA